MSVGRGLRALPPACLLAGLLHLLRGRLRFERDRLGEVVQEDGARFEVFRHMRLRRAASGEPSAPAVLVVRFRFARFSQRANRLLSLLPVLMIAGHPGFRDKLWMADPRTGEWQGLYEWESAAACERYRGSFVLGLMMRRAERSSVDTRVVTDMRVADYLGQR